MYRQDERKNKKIGCYYCKYYKLHKAENDLTMYRTESSNFIIIDFFNLQQTNRIPSCSNCIIIK